ncbi:MAG: cyclic nucleotide-binding/CBS domain-containing protein [Gammaproteobacteria bacterium]|nr:cyclic nucleotide-binding/CBS domain-containing protein [Gammaproteobacteria bacterium]
MDIELQEISDFIKKIHPFEELPQAVIQKLVKNITIRYIRRDTTFGEDFKATDRLYFIRKGAIALFSNENKLLGKLGESDVCTAFCHLEKNISFTIKVEEDTLIYTIECQSISLILKDYPEQLSYLQQASSKRLKQNIAKVQDTSTLASSLMKMPISDIMHYPVVTEESSTSIRDAAITMSENNVSSLILLKQNKVVGILTDKDITRRCIAKNISTSQPVKKIMTDKIFSVPETSNAFEVMMTMTRKQIRHLPIIDDHKLNGIISVTDILRLEGRNSVYITNAISKAESIDVIQELCLSIPQLQLQSVQMGSSPEHISKVLTAVSTAVTRRLIELAEEKLGSAPAPYAWLAAGSHARREQNCHSDQDNALIISDQMKPEDDEWFSALAQFVCDGLNQCGYIYCPGNVMATNPKWRQPARQWNQYFTNWINTPSPKALMYSSIFFDLRSLYGDHQLLDDVREKMLQLSPNNDLFLAHLSFNALKLKPPIGFFRDFVLIHDGEHNDTLDLKHNGLAPIVDLARIYALSEGISEVNTIERLKKVRGTRTLSHEGADDLLDSLEFISNLRMKHQAEQIRIGVEVDNFMAPAEISKLERSHLKDTFKVIQTFQSYLEMRYKIG